MTYILITIVALINLGISLFVYFNNRTKIVNKAFAYFGVSTTIWAISLPLLQATRDLIFSDVLLGGSFLIGSSFLFFVLVFPQGELKTRYYLTFVPAAILLVLLPFRLFVTGAMPDKEGFLQPILGPLFPLVPISIVVYFSTGTYLLYKKYRAAIGTSKSQIYYFLIGMSMFILGAVPADAILPGIGIYNFIIFGPLFVMFMSGFTAYSIVAHRLFDIRVIIKRTVIFAGLSAFTLSMYAAIVFIFSGLFGNQGTGGNAFALASIVPNFVAALVIAFTFEPLRHFLTEATDNWLFKGEYKQEDVIKHLATTLANVIDIDEAIQGMMKVVVEQMRLHKAAVFMLHPNTKQHEHELRGIAKVGEFSDLSLKLAPKDVLVEYFEEMGIDYADLVVTEELLRMGTTGNPHRANFIKRAEALEASVVMPLIISRQEAVVTKPGEPTQTKEVKNLIGILAIGAKKSGDTFSDKDLNLLHIVANETAAAIEKGRFFEEDRLKTEFVSIASHELLTPTTSMKGYLSMILDEGIGKVDPTARGYLEKVYSETNRLAVLVKDLLNVSRIDRGKIVVEPKVQDVMPLLQQAIDTQELKAKESKLTLKLEAPKKALPLVNVDSDKLLEVFINVIGNGLKYTKQGGVTVSLSSAPTQVLVAVKDTGIGIGPKDMAHLFGKFFRASNSDETGQTGTGLGLYVSKYVTELMGGTITVDSVIGKGTTFTIVLPVGTASSSKR